MPRTQHRALVLVSAVAAAALALTLSACTPPAPTPSASGGSATSVPSAGGSSAAPSQAPTVAPTTPPTPPLAVPKVRVPFSCEDAAPAAELTAALGAPVTLTTPVQEFELPELRPYALLEDGALNCSWSIHPGKSGNVTSYRVLVVPDVSPAQWTFYKGNGLGTSDPASPFGANTNLSCNSTEPKSMVCNLTAYIGTNFVDVESYSTKVLTSLSGTATVARFTPLFTNLIAKVKAATIVEPRFTDPDATAVHYHSDFTISDKAITKAVNRPGYHYHSEAWGPIIDEDGPDLEAVSPVNFRWEGGAGGEGATKGYSITSEVLPAGAWALPQIASAAGGSPLYGPLTGVGDQAITWSPTGNSTKGDSVIVAISGHNLFLIDVSWYGGGTPAQSPATVAQNVVKAIISGIGS